MREPGSSWMAKSSTMLIHELRGELGKLKERAIVALDLVLAAMELVDGAEVATVDATASHFYGVGLGVI